jgi:hypothetical protein
MDSHGYVTVDVDPARVLAEWWHLDTILEPSDVETCAAAFAVERGSPRLVREGPAEPGP